MIIHSVRLIIRPASRWNDLNKGTGSTSTWILTEAMTVATIPAVAVVIGHLGSWMLGFEDQYVAVQRASVGLVATFLGAMVMAPALALLMQEVSRHARAPMNNHQAIVTALNLLGPAWLAGFVLAIPPLLNMGPETGEFLWMLLASILAIRILGNGAISKEGIRRRWRRTFLLRGAAVFVLLFALIPLAPAFTMRAALGVESQITFSSPAPMEWPMPPDASW